MYGLDIVRAWAILFVMIAHGSYLAPFEAYQYHEWFTLDGVSIFFVLSGFLIGQIFIKILSKDGFNWKSVRHFWIRRWMRTLPNYFLILLVLISLNLLFQSEFSINEVSGYFLFAQNLFYEHPWFFPEAWSLSIEEWFYLSVPLLTFSLVSALKIEKIKALQLLAIALLVGVTCFRWYRFNQLPAIDAQLWDSLFRKQVITRLDSLMYGVLGAYVFCYHAAFWQKYKQACLWAGIALFGLMKLELLFEPNFGIYKSVFSFSVTSLATVLVLPYMQSIRSGKGWVYSLLTKTSLISYSLYLVNFTLVQKWIIHSIDWQPIAQYSWSLFLYTRYLSFWVISILLSILIYKFFEIPTTQWRDRITKRDA